MFGLDDIVSSVFDTGLSFLGSSLLAGQANDNSAKAAAASYANNVKAFQRRYQDTVVDMKAAGLNPILAATGGFNVSGAPTMPMAQTFQGSLSGTHPISSSAKDYAETDEAVTSARKNEAEMQRTFQDIQNKKQDIKESVQRIAESRAREGKLTQEEMLVGKQIINTVEDTIVKIEQARNLRSEIIKNLSVADLNDQEKQRVKADIARLNEYTKNIRIATANLETEYTRLNKISNVYKIPYYGEFLAGTHALINSLTGGFLGSMANAIPK